MIWSYTELEWEFECRLKVYVYILGTLKLSPRCSQQGCQSSQIPFEWISSFYFWKTIDWNLLWKNKLVKFSIKYFKKWNNFFKQELLEAKPEPFQSNAVQMYLKILVLLIDQLWTKVQYKLYLCFVTQKEDTKKRSKC